MTKSKIVAFVAVAAMFVASSASAFVFNTNLGFGMRNSDVRELQLRLNQEVGTSLPGTTYFGPATRSAARSYQTMKGITPVSGFVGPLTRAALNGSTPSTGGSTTLPAGCTSTVGFSPTTGMPCNGASTGSQTGPVTAMLSSTNPASGTLVAGQATADLAHFTFTGSGTVNSVTLQRIGVSGDTTLSNVYLFDGATRLTDAASVTNNGMITFSSGSGLFTVNGSKTISVRSDILTNTSGETVGVRLNSFTTGGSTVTANVSANLHSIASATLATVSAGTVTPSGATLNPGSNVTVWQSSLSIGQRDVMMKRFAIRQVGSASASSFANFKLFVNGTQVATASGVDSMGYVTFDMMSNPVTLTSGSRLVRVDADIVSGASRTVNFSVRQAADVDFVDSAYGVNIAPTSAPWAPSADNTIGGVGGGSLTIEKDTSSPTQPVAVGANDVKLATFKATAYGEPIKIETLKVNFLTADTSVDSLRNGKLMINGVQYGSSGSLVTCDTDSDGDCDGNDTAGVGTSFTTNFTVYPGTPVMIDVYADMFDNDGTNNLTGGESFTVRLLQGSSNASKQDSLGYINAPVANVSANPVTATSATVSLARQTTYANQTIVVPQTSGYKIGAWTMTGSSVEDVLITNLSFDVDEVSDPAHTFNEADLTNLTVVIKDASGNVVAAPSPRGTVDAADNNFSVSYTLPKNAVATVELMATVGSSVTDTHSMKTDLSITGTSAQNGTAVSVSDVDGQTIIAGTGSITATKDASSADARIVTDNQTIDVAAYKFEALYSAYNVTDLTFTIADASTVSTISLWDGSTKVAEKAGATSVVFNSLNWNIPANTSKVLTVKLALGTVGVGAGTTGSSLLTTLTDFTATSVATGVSAAGTESNPASSATYVYAAIPMVTNQTLPTVQLSTGTNTVARFNIAASGGTIGWKKLIFNVTRSIGGTDTLSNVTLWDADSNTQIAGTPTFSGSVEADNGTTGTIAFVADNEQQISSSKTYILKLDVAGTLASGNNINVNIGQPLTAYDAPDAYADVITDDATASFVWTDQSSASHSVSTDDWNHGYLVKNLPTDSQTLRVN